jgi:cyclopropane fatty-acyl-phospholipid synthase-like methyltransferase
MCSRERSERRVLDVGCGSGKAMNLLARAFPNSRFTGYVLSEETIARARAGAQEHATTNVRFEVKDAAKLDERASCDLITTFDAVHDQADPVAVLKGIAEALKDDGVYLMQDIAGSSHHHNNLDHPVGPFLYTFSTTHCTTVSLSQGGEGLGTMWGEEKAKEMLQDAGYKDVEVKQLPHDFMNNYISKKS